MLFLAHLSDLTLVAYAALAMTVIALWLPGRVWIVMAVIAIALGIASGVLTVLAVPWLVALTAAALGTRSARTVVSNVSWVVVLLLSLALGLHVVPGFHNARVIDAAVITPGAVPYTLYLNFDKTIAGIAILGLAYPALFQSRESWRTAIRRAAPLIPLVIAALIGASWVSGYVKLDPKAGDLFLLWAPANLLFTCMSEEAFFRGFIQRRLATVAAPWIALSVTAVLFGFAHIGGGLTYVVLSTVAGFGYGYVYQRTQSVEMAILTHFAVNATHILFFTYPALA